MSETVNEMGAADPSHPGWRRATDHELAARLSYFLTDSTPDAALLASADAGELAGRADVLAGHAQRLLANKISALTANSPSPILAANIGCQAHLLTATDLPVRHWIEALDDILSA